MFDPPNRNIRNNNIIHVPVVYYELHIYVYILRSQLTTGYAVFMLMSMDEVCVNWSCNNQWKACNVRTKVEETTLISESTIQENRERSYNIDRRPLKGFV